MRIMFWKKKDYTIELLTERLRLLEAKVDSIEFKKAMELPREPTVSVKDASEDLRLTLIQQRIGRLENPPKFKGEVIYKGSKYEVLSAGISEVREFFGIKYYENTYTLVHRVDGVLIQVHGVKENELSKPKRK